MSEQSLSSIFDRIRTICKECKMQSMPTRFTTLEDAGVLEGYARAVEIIRAEVLRVLRVDQEYANLEGMLQRYERELRRRAGIENQLRLQLQVCKQQLDELQNEKLELLDNSKNCIKDLKRVNEQLFEQLAAHASKGRNNLVEIEKPLKKGLKEKAEESSKLFYRARPRRQQSIKQITKTQYIERQHNMIELKKNRRINNFKAHSSIMTEVQDQKPVADDNFHTFQDTNIPNTERRLKKANKCLGKGVSRKDKSKDRDAKSPHRGNVMLLKNRMELMTKHISRNRKHNRSIYSVLSAEHSQSQLEFQ